MGYDLKMRIWRGDQDGGDLGDYTVEVSEGEVVLDALHRVQATQAGDLAIRWNCKAGKCGSCSAEINGRPRLLCMTRLSDFAPSETITVTPMRSFPVIRDLVTDVSFNYEKAKELPVVPAAAARRRQQAPDGAGRRGARARSSASASSASCARTPATSCATTRRTSRRSPGRGSSCATPSSTCTRSTPTTAASWPRGPPASACATSPSAAPRSAPRASRSPTTRSSR